MRKKKNNNESHSMLWATSVPTTGAVTTVFLGVLCLVGADAKLALAKKKNKSGSHSMPWARSVPTTRAVKSVVLGVHWLVRANVQLALA